MNGKTFMSTCSVVGLGIAVGRVLAQWLQRSGMPLFSHQNITIRKSSVGRRKLNVSCQGTRSGTILV